ncbi:unnamed protein product [Didymodactylos carnosus]|uniref:Uncharacterized protein n=1 Tax=Didymodactylos carnosus TaxID=1234261 RepID=A0A816AL60_9BILA|nr:unnamed protein product [Didymodactylos carnosus]CAF1597005.1 unnamed protein product [Didymodactylos carnosus]CAF4323986.1 unnamed protein product [Didymodactylos carnosus]CAF4472185.1 unnamed protein product [Didymodactylos carnosus]
MVSDYLVQHPSGPFFELSESEFDEASRKFPELLAPTDIDYIDRTGTASIQVGKDAYFHNQTILSQFERLFQLIKFKTEFEGHDIHIIVDNARTHSAKSHSVTDFGKSIGTR